MRSTSSVSSSDSMYFFFLFIQILVSGSVPMVHLVQYVSNWCLHCQSRTWLGSLINSPLLQRSSPRFRQLLFQPYWEHQHTIRSCPRKGGCITSHRTDKPGLYIWS